MTGERSPGAICGGGLVELHREPDRVRWCFHCRTHLPHDFVVMGDPETHPEPSYYEPNPRYDCSRCHQDHTTFPGTAREWSYE